MVSLKVSVHCISSNSSTAEPHRMISTSVVSVHTAKMTFNGGAIY